MYSYRDGPTGVDDSFELDVGNYTRTQLEAALAEKLNEIGYSMVFTVNHRTDLENGKITISCTGLTGSK